MIILVRNTKNRHNTEVPELVIPVEGGIREARQQVEALQSNDRKRNFRFHIAQTTNIKSAKNYIMENQM